MGYAQRLLPIKNDGLCENVNNFTVVVVSHLKRELLLTITLHTIAN